MTKGIYSTDRFQNDLKKYKSAVEKISNETEKAEAQKILNDLILNVKRMDNMYLDMVYSGQLTSVGSEMREKILDIRKRLESKLKITI